MEIDDYKLGDILYQYKKINNLQRFEVITINILFITLKNTTLENSERENNIYCSREELNKYFFRTEQLAKHNLIETYTKTINDLKNKIIKYERKLNELKQIYSG